MPIIEAVQSNKPSNDEALSDAIAATAKRFKNQPNIDEALEICNHFGLEVKDRPTKSKWFADAYPEYFTYNPNGRKLNYKPQAQS